MNGILKKFFMTSAIAVLTVTVGTASADDTDVYINPGSGLPAGSQPMIMFSLDYRPNLGSAACQGSECDKLIAEGYMSAVGPYTFFDVLRGALRKVFDPLEDVRVGLMLNHQHNQGCSSIGQTNCSGGGYIAMGFDEFTAGDTNGAKARFLAILDAMPTPQGIQSHSYQGKELFFEFFRYLTGQGVYNGHNGWNDYGTDSTDNLDVDGQAFDWDSSIESGQPYTRTYTSPLASAGQCTRIYTINPMFQVSNQDDDSDSAIAASVASGGFGGPKRQFADVIQYLNDADLADGSYGLVSNLDGKQNVTSYFIVDPVSINQTTTGYSQAGGTGVPLALSDDPDELVETLQEIFKQILSVSTTFVAGSVPVNVFNRAEITDNIFIALFQVDKDSKPYWVGNVKKLKLIGANTPGAGTAVVDVGGSPAIAGDGRIRFDALTYWTSPGDLPIADPAEGEVTGKDGRTVARGGAGQMMSVSISGSPQLANGLGGRTIYYDNTPSSLADFDVDAATGSALQSVLGAADVNEAQDLIEYARGMDIDDLDGDSTTNEARQWIFGDPLHSRPLPLNYGAFGGHSATSPAIYIAVASNDGMLRMIENTTPGGAESGAEVWAFMPKTSMPAQKTLRANASGVRHPYTMDGAPVAFIQDSNHNGTIEAGEKVFLYVGLRRGGHAYYALDVTNPLNPQLMWTITNSGSFAELGYTFSNPRVGMVNTGGGPRPVVMFAGGYDMNKDLRGGVGTDDPEGAAIYVVDAETGNLIWKARGGSGGASATVYEHAGLVDSIPSALTVADTDGDGYTDRIIAGDSGGNIWRADLAGTDTANWKLSLLASVGRHAGGSSGVSDDRRFFHRPDLVQSQDENGVFDAVLIGSGDRADPLDNGGVASNWFYMIKDRNTGVGTGVDTGLGHANFVDITDNCLQEGSSCGLDLTHGWKLEMEDTGEKILATPLTITGKVFFTSYLPQGGSSASACAPSEGAGRLYALSLQEGASVVNYDSTDDDPDNPGEAGTKNDRYTDLNSAGIPAEVVSIPPDKILRPDLQIDDIDVNTRWRTYWHLAEDVDLP